MIRFICCFVLCTGIFSQHAQTLRGKVQHAGNRQPVSFAVILTAGTSQGTTSDIDGNFELPLSPGQEKIIVQAFGYKTATISVESPPSQQPLLISLQSDVIALAEVVIKAGENPAIPVIRKLISEKESHHIDQLESYSCISYAKTYFTVCDKNGDEHFYQRDSSAGKTAKMLSRSYLFFMETVSERKYKFKDQHQERILSSKVSGFKKAPFGSFASQLQSFTFYRDHVELLGVKYLSPLIPGTFSRYEFYISDSVIQHQDTTLLIRFYPKKNTLFKGMKGLLYVHLHPHVLTNVLAEPAEPEEGTSVTIQQLYEKADSSYWYPKQLNTEIIFHYAKVTSETGKERFMKAVSRVYISDFNKDSAVTFKNKNLLAYHEEGYEQKNEEYWTQKRKDSLNSKEKETYQVVDSLSEKAKLEQTLAFSSSLVSGKVPMGFLDLDLKRILRANEFENIRLGAGIETNGRVSRWFSMGAWGGYGFRDKAWKYGAFTKFFFNRQQSVFLMTEAASDLAESAGTSFYAANESFLSTQRVRDLMVAKMDRVNFGRTALHTQLLNGYKGCVYLSVQERSSDFGFYSHDASGRLSESKKFTLVESGVQLRFTAGEKYIESLGQLLPVPGRWPIFYVNLARGMTERIDIYKGEFDYWKVDLRIDHQLDFKVKGFFAWQVQAGKVLGEVPYSLRYNNKGARSEALPVSAEKSFETMFLNEFASDEYAALFLALNTGRIFKFRKFQPQLELVHNYGIGNLYKREQLTFVELNDMSRGYSEAGLRIKNIIRSGFSTLGAGVFYRYGHYSLPQADKNFVYKLVLGFSY